MGINPILMAFILITWIAFKSLILVNGTAVNVANNFIPISINCPNNTLINVSSAPDGVCLNFTEFTNLDAGNCGSGIFGGIADCLEFIAKAFIAVIKFVIELILVLFAIIANFVLLLAFYFIIGLSPIEGAPAVMNLILITPFILGNFALALSFFR